MAYASITKPSLHFNTKLYTGNGGTNAITGVGHQPDFTWLKRRDGTSYWWQQDAVRGVTKAIYSNSSEAEGTQNYGITSFNSDGFTLGNSGDVNGNSNSYVSYNWKANGSGSANTDGSINSTVSVNNTAGFSIVTYTGNNTNGATVGHGLGVAPAMVIFKNRGSTNSWHVYHKDLSTPQTSLLLLDTTGATYTSNNYMSGTVPSSSLLYLGNTGSTNENGVNHIAYCFAEKTGYSKFGKYIGNGNADGTFIYTGFKPAFVITKASSTAQSWQMSDNKRDTFNAVDHRLRPNEMGAESTSPEWIDFCSNGFKLRNNDVAWNGSGASYIYMAFAEEPLVANSGSNGVPATAR